MEEKDQFIYNELVKPAFDQFENENIALRSKIPAKPSRELYDYIGDLSHICGRMQTFTGFTVEQGQYVLALTNAIGALNRLEALRASHPAKNVGEIYAKDLFNSAVDLAVALKSAAERSGQSLLPETLEDLERFQSQVKRGRGKE